MIRCQCSTSNVALRMHLVLQGPSGYSFSLTAYAAGGRPLEDTVDMTLTDGAGSVIWQISGASDEKIY